MVFVFLTNFNAKMLYFLNKINIGLDEVLDLAGTKPFGYTSFSPGPGFGGHCIPIDPFYLYWLAKQKNFENGLSRRLQNLHLGFTSLLLTF